jgi:hypothetical protein
MYRRLKEHMTYTMFIQCPLSTSRYIVEFPEGVPLAFCTYKGETFWKLNNIPTCGQRALNEHGVSHVFL